MPDDTPQLSAAARRRLAWPGGGPSASMVGSEWFCEFRETDMKGDLAWEEGVIRRDPTMVLKIDGVFFVWYTKGEGETVGFGSGDPEAKVFPWDKTEVWYATSPDGTTWKEEGPAVQRGPAGAFDDRAVFTPEILSRGGKYYLSYQVVKAPYVVRVKNQIAIAVADSPHGPWEKLPEPSLSAADDGEWEGDADDRFAIKSPGSFDSHKVHDPCILERDGEFWLYYKGEQMGEGRTHGGRNVRWGVAIADSPTGPYTKSPLNPITNSGHEICVWKYRGGVAALLTTDGPEKNTVQYAEDGLNFEIIGRLKGAPEALGLYIPDDADSAPLASLAWGVCHGFRGGTQHIRRFESHVPARI